jgi:catechol-2,3-dioxygenase
MSMTTRPDAQLCHIGLYAFDLEKMVDFYSRVFGLVVTDRGHSARGFDIAFLSRDPIEHHQIAIASGRPKDAVHTTINQISFRVQGLEELRQYYPWLVKEGVKKLDPRNHGNAWSIYFSDPEGNRGDPRQDRSHGEAGPDLHADGGLRRADAPEDGQGREGPGLSAAFRRFSAP